MRLLNLKAAVFALVFFLFLFLLNRKSPPHLINEQVIERADLTLQSSIGGLIPRPHFKNIHGMFPHKAPSNIHPMVSLIEVVVARLKEEFKPSPPSNSFVNFQLKHYSELVKQILNAKDLPVINFPMKGQTHVTIGHDVPDNDAKQIFVLGAARTGSTFLMELLNSHPGVLSFYEPYNGIRLDSKSEVVANILKCNHQDRWLHQTYNTRQVR